jgi:hypothetical protein
MVVKRNQIGRGGFPRKENPRAILQAGNILILALRQRQAPDDPIGLRYPIREYQSGRLSMSPSSADLITFGHQKEVC